MRLEHTDEKDPKSDAADVHGSQVTQLTDTQLIQELQGGNDAAYSLLYNRYRHKVFAFSFRLLLDSEDAQDVVQEVFLKVLNNFHSLQNADLFRSWLFSIARREVLSHLRRSKRVEHLDNDDDVFSKEDTPLEDAIKTQEKDIVRHYLDLLKPSYRELLVLREYGGLSCTEISEVTGIAESTVRSGLFRARKALADKLKPILREDICDNNGRE